MRSAFKHVQRALQTAGLRSTHLETGKHQEYNGQHEIKRMLKAAKEMVPQLHKTLVWIPCKQCANTATGLCCMDLVDSIDVFHDKTYFYANEFHHLQIQKGVMAKAVMSSSDTKSCFCRNICDFSQSENLLAHYAQKSRLSFCFAICLESPHNSNSLYYLEFFLQPNGGQDSCDASICHLLIGVMETILKSYKVTSPSHMLEVRKDMLSNSIELVPHNMPATLEVEKHQHSNKPNILMKINSRGSEMYPSELEFQKYLQMDDHFSCFKSQKIFTTTWLFWCPEREEQYENDESYSSLLQNSTLEKIKLLLTNLVSRLFSSLVQFWAPIMIEGRCYLSTSGQTFALSGLHKGLAFFRKRCMKHQYFVDKGPKGEDRGPVGRVFRSWHPETTHNVGLYSTAEFQLKDDAAFSNLTSYIAFPLLDHQHKCLGVLEFIGNCENIEDALEYIQNEVKAVHLSSANINHSPDFEARFAPALGEIKEAFRLVNKIPQLHLTTVWVPRNKCANTNNSLRCMQSVSMSEWERKLPCVVETGKGIVGRVLKSENKCCYCKRSCRFSITEQSRSHHAQLERLDVWFAICLQSSYTGDLPFILNFFLNQGPGHQEYLGSFLYYLLPILKQQLKSFKVATGKQLGDELVVDIIEFSHEVNRPTSVQFGQPNMFPVKCQIVQYGQQEYQQSEDQQVNEMDHDTSAVADGNQCSPPVTSLEMEEETSLRGTEKGKMRSGLRISLEDLKGQFGKNREDAAKNLSVSISTFKRACRFHNIHRWPSNKKHRKNPSLYMTKNANAHDGDPQHSRGPYSSSRLHLPLHENVPPTNIECNKVLTLVPETDDHLVTIKAAYEDDIVKFQFDPSLGLDKLIKEVATRLNLEMGSFKLKYVDEDNDPISLACDADLQLYVKSLKGAGKNCLRLFVRLSPAK